MKRLTNALILVAALGAFFSGFVFWMAHLSHQQAEHLRRHGRYCEVDVVGMHTSSPGDGSSTSHYVEIHPVGAAADSVRIVCGVVPSTYDDLHVGQRLNAWVLGTDALLDYGPKNAGSVAQTMLVTFVSCGAAVFVGIGIRLIHRLFIRHEEIA
jgi:hypothetical protein